MTKWNKITWSTSADCHSVVSMAFQMNCYANSGAVFLFVSLFSCLFCVGEGRFSAFRAFRGEPVASAGDPEELWFTQKLDHFNGADGRVWKQVSRNWAGKELAFKQLSNYCWQTRYICNVFIKYSLVMLTQLLHFEGLLTVRLL